MNEVMIELSGRFSAIVKGRQAVQLSDMHASFF
jgi:hypothetical protein